MHFYFDHNATTPVSDKVLQLYTAVLRETYGNASSIHHFGQEAKSRLDRARGQVAWMLACQPKEIIFTGGGTEANNIAIFGAVRHRGTAGKHVITTEIEHPAVLNTCAALEREGVDVTFLPVGSSGVVDPDEVRRALRPETALVSVMHANNETGVVQPVEEIAEIAREAGAVFHSDGVQAAGKLPADGLPPPADLYALSGHKFHAPKGIGVLYIRSGTPLEPFLFGGHHEQDLRPGTQDVPGAVAIGAAAGAARKSVAGEAVRLAGLRDRLEQSILDRVPNAGVNGTGPRVPNTTNIYFDGIGAESLVIALDLRGFAVSSGSACSSGSIEPSHVLLAMGVGVERTRSSVRFSLGRSNDEEQVDALVEAVVASVEHLRRISPAA